MRLVVDASVAAEWLVEEEYSVAADRLLERSHELLCSSADGAGGRECAVAKSPYRRDRTELGRSVGFCHLRDGR